MPAGRPWPGSDGVRAARSRSRTDAGRPGLSGRASGGWVIVFRDPRTEEPVACAYPRGVLSAYDLWVAPDETYRLRENPLTNAWTPCRDRSKLARMTGRAPARSVAVLDAIVPDPQLALVIVLGYETTQDFTTIPQVGDGGGAGG